MVLRAIWPRKAHTERDVELKGYRGYGSREEIFLIGRVFRQPRIGDNDGRHQFFGAMIALGQRLRRRGIADAVVEASFSGSQQQVRTDRDGYFRVHLRLSVPPPRDILWHTMGLELLAPISVRADAIVFIAPVGARCVVISDIDDTVMHTGVGNKALMLWRLFMQRAENRVAFPGVAMLLQAFHNGASGTEHNPMLYVSRAPWSIYEVLDGFFRQHDIPVGPVLFLREWGMTLQRPLPRRGKAHKLELIRRMLGLYHDLPFVLIGDSGQRDPEIYAQVVREQPGRVLAIYIRNVTSAAARHHAIAQLAAEVAEAGSSLILAHDSLAMAVHAADRGLITPAAMENVRAAVRASDASPGSRREVVRITGASPQATRAAIEGGELEQVLDSDRGEGQVADIVVEPSRSDRP